MLSRASKAREELLSALSRSAVPGSPASSLCLSAHMCHPPKETNRNDWSQCGPAILQVDSDQEDFLCIIIGYTRSRLGLLSVWRAHAHSLAQKHYHPLSSV